MTSKNAQVATEFEEIIQKGRERKQNEALAAKVFSRRASTPQQRNASPAGSLASRVGIQKRSSASNVLRRNGSSQAASTPTGPASMTNGSLASRIAQPGQQSAASKQQNRRAVQLNHALSRTQSAPQVNLARKAPAVAPPAAAANNNNNGFSIRGLAGPYVVMAQNFAPGTTAADIESAMTPVGGIILGCRLIKTNPIVIAQIEFESKQGAEKVIEMFNNQTADGRTLYVYAKLGNVLSNNTQAQPAPGNRSTGNNPPSGPRSMQKQQADQSRARSPARDNRDTLVDGTQGFADPMEEDEAMDAPVSDRRNDDLFVEDTSRSSRGNNYNESRRDDRGGGRRYDDRPREHRDRGRGGRNSYR